MKRRKEEQFQYLCWNLRTVRLANRMRIRQMARILGIRPVQLWLLEHRFCPEVSCEFLFCFNEFFDVQPWEMLEKPLLKRKKER